MAADAGAVRVGTTAGTPSGAVARGCAASAGEQVRDAGRFHLRVQVCDHVTGKPLRWPRPMVAIAVSMLRQTFPLTLGYDIGVSVQVGGEIAAFTVALA